MEAGVGRSSGIHETRDRRGKAAWSSHDKKKRGVYTSSILLLQQFIKIKIKTLTILHQLNLSTDISTQETQKKNKMGKSALKQTAKKGGAKKVSLVVGGKVEKTGAAKAAVKTVKKVKKVAGKKTTDKKTGVLYIGHIPHGYYEKQMRNFLAQYGKILRLRISRNKKTGKSKGMMSH